MTTWTRKLDRGNIMIVPAAVADQFNECSLVARPSNNGDGSLFVFPSQKMTPGDVLVDCIRKGTAVSVDPRKKNYLKVRIIIPRSTARSVFGDNRNVTITWHEWDNLFPCLRIRVAPSSIVQ